MKKIWGFLAVLLLVSCGSDEGRMKKSIRQLFQANNNLDVATLNEIFHPKLDHFVGDDEKLLALLKQLYDNEYFKEKNTNLNIVESDVVYNQNDTLAILTTTIYTSKRTYKSKEAYEVFKRSMEIADVNHKSDDINLTTIQPDRKIEILMFSSDNGGNWFAIPDPREHDVELVFGNGQVSHIVFENMENVREL